MYITIIIIMMAVYKPFLTTRTPLYVIKIFWASILGKQYCTYKRSMFRISEWFHTILCIVVLQPVDLIVLYYNQIVVYIVQKKKVNSTRFQAEAYVHLSKFEFANGLLSCKLYHKIYRLPFPPLSNTCSITIL